MVSGPSSRSDDRGWNPAPTTAGTLEKPSPVGSSHGFNGQKSGNKIDDIGLV